VSRAFFGNNFRIRNRRNEAAERRPINFKFFNGVGAFSGLGVDYEYRHGAQSTFGPASGPASGFTLLILLEVRSLGF